MRTNASPVPFRTRSVLADFGCEGWLAAVLLVGVATLFALYVIVLQQDVHHGQLQRAEAHARAVAEADCELQQPAESRAGCRALLQGGEVGAVAAAAPPENNLAGNATRLATASTDAVNAQ
jgi:hypothetical protein